MNPGICVTRAALAFFVLLASSACAGGSDSSPQTSEPPRATAEINVQPGYNERFLSEDLDVERYTKIFESESREIYVERRAIVEALGLSAGMAVADVGAGTGLFLEHFSDAVGPSGRVYAVDISPKFVEHLESRAKEQALANVTVVLGGDRSAELAARSVDLAFVCDTYHHFEYPKSMLASLRGAIRSGGQLIVVDFDRILGESKEWILDHVRADKDTFAAEIQAAGFELLEEVEIEGLRENFMLRFRRR